MNEYEACIVPKSLVDSLNARIAQLEAAIESVHTMRLNWGLACQCKCSECDILFNGIRDVLYGYSTAETGTEHKYPTGVCVHLKRWPEPGPRQEENAGWIITKLLPERCYLLGHCMGGVTNVREDEIAYQVSAGLAANQKV